MTCVDGDVKPYSLTHSLTAPADPSAELFQFHMKYIFSAHINISQIDADS